MAKRGGSTPVDLVENFVLPVPSLVSSMVLSRSQGADALVDGNCSTKDYLRSGCEGLEKEAVAVARSWR